MWKKPFEISVEQNAIVLSKPSFNLNQYTSKCDAVYVLALRRN